MEILDKTTCNQHHVAYITHSRQTRSVGTDSILTDLIHEKNHKPQIMSISVICLEETAFYELIEKVIERLKVTRRDTDEEWISGSEAMQLLNIKSKTTLQALRDTGKIRYSQPQKRVILYDKKSIYSYLNNHAQQTF